MRYMARVLRAGVMNVGSLDFVELMRWVMTRIVLLIGWALVLVGLVLAPTPIPVGLPMIAVGTIIILNVSTTAKKVFVRWGQQYPRTVGRVRNWIRDRRRTSHRRRNGDGSV